MSTRYNSAPIEDEENIILTKIGKISLMHLDNPTPEIIDARLREIIRDEISGAAFDDDCHLCQQLIDNPYTVIFDDPTSILEDEEDPEDDD